MSKIQKKKIFRIRWKLLIFTIAISILPAFFVCIFVYSSILQHLKSQSQKLYSRVLDTVSQNIDDFYDEYAIEITNLVQTGEVTTTLAKPRFKSEIEEQKSSSNLFGNPVFKGEYSIYKTFLKNIEGALFIYDFDQISFLNNTQYKLYNTTNKNVFISPPDYDRLITDPLFKKIQNDNSIKMLYGKLQKGTIPGQGGDCKNVILYPYYPEPPKDHETSFSSLLVILLHNGFERSFFSNIEELNYGTLYALDSSNNILFYNHPAEDIIGNYNDSDYFEYNFEKNAYSKNKMEAYDKLSNMSFKDYQRLITDPAVLNKSSIKKIIKSMDNNNEGAFYNELHTVTYGKYNYLVILSKAPSSQVKLLFFMPIAKIYNPVYVTLLLMLVFIAVIVAMAIVISLIISNYFTKPIDLLAEASLTVSNGNYNEYIEIETNDEIGILCKNFNLMIKNVQDYKDRIVYERSELEKTKLVAMKALAKLAEYRDESTGKHLERVQEYTRLLTILLRRVPKYSGYITDRYLIDITHSSMLHDIGKVGIDNSVLLKPGALTEDEYNEIKKHTVIGGDALDKADKEWGETSFLTLAKEICYFHHEKFDGTGYPKGLSGEDIPLSARITAISDVYDALTSNRCYRKALDHSVAVQIMVEKDKGHFDPEILQCFLDNQNRFIEIRNKLKDDINYSDSFYS